jgi:List-Bact-rpt repeat protein/flagellar hook capping protein FlgD
MSRASFLSRTMAMAAVISVCLAPSASAQTAVYSNPPTGSGALVLSSWLDPDGSDADLYGYDSFTLGSSQAITEVRWRGGYQYGGIYGRVWDFSITFYESAVNGTQPYCTNPQLPEFYLAHYPVGGTAGETFVGNFGGVALYDYGFTLPSAFLATAGVKYWIRIEASQVGYPDWGVAAGSGDDAQHFQFSTGAARFSFAANDEAFTLLTSGTPSFAIAASASPAYAGTVAGAGAYPDGSTATLVATANPGYGFVSWTEGVTTVSNSATYAFTVTGDRALVANFVPAWTIATSASPAYGGTTAGDGAYNDGAPVTVTAVPNAGFAFVDWTEFGVEVSTSASYGFAAAADRALTANFAALGTSAMFDLDTGTPALFTGQGIPIDQTSGGITAQFSSPQGSAFSIQTDGSTGWWMPFFSGHYLYDNNLNRNVLVIRFFPPIETIAFAFATADAHQNEVPTTLQLTAYLEAGGPTPVGTATAHGTYGTGTMPGGALSFAPGVPFDRVELVLPYQPLGCTDFFVDNIVVTTTSPLAAPDPAGAPIRILSVTPNPTRGALDLWFSLPAPAEVSAAVYDPSGRRVSGLRSGPFAAGRHSIAWDGRDADGAPAPAGVYFVRLEASGVRLARKVAVIR